MPVSIALLHNTSSQRARCTTPAVSVLACRSRGLAHTPTRKPFWPTPPPCELCTHHTQARSAAIEELQRSLAHLQPMQARQLQDALPQFVACVLGLAQDCNFTIAAAGLHILGETAAQLGPPVAAHIRSVQCSDPCTTGGR